MAMRVCYWNKTEMPSLVQRLQHVRRQTAWSSHASLPVRADNKRGLIRKDPLDGVGGKKLIRDNPATHDAIWQVAGARPLVQMVNRHLGRIPGCRVFRAATTNVSGKRDRPKLSIPNAGQDVLPHALEKHVR